MMLRIERRIPAPLMLLLTVISYCWVSIVADAALSKESALVPQHHSYNGSIDSSNSRKLADFEWDIVRKAGYPIFSFANNTESEVMFKYSVSGTETGAYGVLKYLQASVFLADCNSTANLPAILLQEALTEADEFTVELNILQEFISDSDYYNQVDPTNATIDFCIRVDYVYDPVDGSDESVINFHETNVTLAVDLTAGFSLTGIAVDRDAAEQASAAISLQYPVVAYFCDEGSVEIPPPIFSQGAVLQFCVEINENVTTSGVYVSDLMSVDLDQSSGGVHHADIITGSVADWLTRKTCSAGICNIKTQLTSKWFAEIDPESMDITGTALLAFGTATRRRYMRVAFGTAATNQDDQQQQRKLIDLKDSETITGPIEDLLSEFGLTVDLEGPSTEDDNRLGMIIVCVAASVSAIILCQIVSCCCCRNKVTTKTTTTNIYDNTNNERVQPSPTFYPPPPLPSPYPKQASPPALYSAPSSFRQSFTQHQTQSNPYLYGNSDTNHVSDSSSFRQSFAQHQTKYNPSLRDNNDSYDVTDYSGFAIATKVTPATDGRMSLHNKESCYDDEVIVVAVPIVTASKRHTSHKSSSRHSSGRDGLRRQSSSRHSSRHDHSDGHNRSDHSQPESGMAFCSSSGNHTSRKSSHRHGSGGLNRSDHSQPGIGMASSSSSGNHTSRKSSRRHGRSDGLNRSDHRQPESGMTSSSSSDSHPGATCQFID